MYPADVDYVRSYPGVGGPSYNHLSLWTFLVEHGEVVKSLTKMKPKMSFHLPLDYPGI